MIGELERYLRAVRENLRLGSDEEQEVLSELETHAEERIQEMEDSGLSEEEATRRCLGLLGSARLVARQIYEVHHQGTWRQALLAALPHLFFAALFALKLWERGGLPVVLGVVGAIAIYGWSHGKPNWLFPWLGYALLPVVAAGLVLIYLPTGWALVSIFLYVPLVVWLLCYTVIKSIRRDWVYIAFMLLPVPTIVGWFLAANPDHAFASFDLGLLQQYGPWACLSFLMLGVTTTLFVRLARRRVRLLLLNGAGLASLVIVTASTTRLGLGAFLVLSLLMLVFLWVPALVEWRIHRQHGPALP